MLEILRIDSLVEAVIVAILF